MKVKVKNRSSRRFFRRRWRNWQVQCSRNGVWFRVFDYDKRFIR